MYGQSIAPNRTDQLCLLVDLIICDSPVVFHSIKGEDSGCNAPTIQTFGPYHLGLLDPQRVHLRDGTPSLAPPPSLRLLLFSTMKLEGGKQSSSLTGRLVGPSVAGFQCGTSTSEGEQMMFLLQRKPFFFFFFT